MKLGDLETKHVIYGAYGYWVYRNLTNPNTWMWMLGLLIGHYVIWVPVSGAWKLATGTPLVAFLEQTDTKSPQDNYFSRTTDSHLVQKIENEIEKEQYKRAGKLVAELIEKTNETIKICPLIKTLSEAKLVTSNLNQHIRDLDRVINVFRNPNVKLNRKAKMIRSLENLQQNLKGMVDLIEDAREKLETAGN